MIEEALCTIMTLLTALQARTLTTLSLLAASLLSLFLLLHSLFQRLLQRLRRLHLSLRQQQPHRLHVIPLVTSRAAVSRGSDMENKLPRVLNDTVGLFVLFDLFLLFGLVLFL